MATIEELIKASLEKKPVDAQSIFDELIHAKIAENIAGLKDSVRDVMFNGVEPPEDEDEEDEDEDADDSDVDAEEGETEEEDADSGDDDLEPEPPVKEDE